MSTRNLPSFNYKIKTIDNFKLVSEDLDDQSTASFFSSIANRIIKLGIQFGFITSQVEQEGLNLLHKLFYQVSCDWDQFAILLKLKSQGNEGLPHQWNVFEDLAIMDDEDSEAYKYLQENLSAEDILKRKLFL